MLTSHNLLQPLRITATDVKVFHSVRKESLKSWTAAVRCWLVGWKSSSPFAAPFTHAPLAVFFPYQFSFILSTFSNYFFPLKQTPSPLPVQPATWIAWPWCKGTERTTILVHHPWRPSFNPQLQPPAWKFASSGLIVSMAWFYGEN